MSLPTLASLLSTPSADQLAAVLLQRLRDAGFPVDDWESGGTAKALVDVDILALKQYAADMVPAIAASGLLMLATGDWLTVFAHYNYLTDRNEPTFTEGTVLLSASAAASGFTKGPGELWFVAASGRRYNSTSSVTVAPGGHATVNVKAESPGALFNDSNNSITTMLTPLPGVSVTNPPAPFSGPTTSVRGSGLIGLTHDTSIPLPATVQAVIGKILTSGNVGVATFALSVDAGATYGATYATAASVPLTTILGGISATFIDGASTPSFVAGDTFAFNVPGDWRTAIGTDEETDAALQFRCQARWPELAAIPTAAVYELWARRASAQVTQALATTDLTVPGQVNLYVATAAGTTPSSVLNAVQDYVKPRAPETDRVLVVAPGVQNLSVTGTIRVPLAHKVAAQDTVRGVISKYISSVPIGGLLEAAQLAQLLMEIGPGLVLDVINLQISSYLDYQLSPTSLARYSGNPLTDITWTTT